MNIDRHEYLDHMTFKANKRPLFTEIFGPLVGLPEEWKTQGATPEEINLSAFRYRRPTHGDIHVNTGWMGGREPVLIEETDEFTVSLDRMGRTMKLFKKSATIPLPLDHPVKTMDDWKKIRHHYEFSETRLAHDWEEIAKAHIEAGSVLLTGIPGGFDEPRQLMGEEPVCLAYYEQPELIHDILDTIGETAFRVLEHVSSKIRIDQLNVHEDMAGKSGPLAGPKQIDEFIRPYYKKIWDLLESRGARIFYQDSDGDMSTVVEPFIRTGLNAMGPVEPTGNQDIVKLREKFGSRMAFLGGIDKHALRKTKKDILAELEYRVPPMVRTGGCMLGLDHRIPNGTPIENYRFYIEKIWEILDRHEHTGTGSASPSGGRCP